MRLAILNITAGGLSGGSIKYLRSVIPHLLMSREVSGLLVAVPEGADFVRWQTEYPSVEWVALKPKSWLLRDIDMEEEKKIADFSPDVVFIPTSRFWKIGNIPVVSMVRNMEPLVRLKCGDTFFRKIKLAAQYWNTKYVAFKVDRIIAVSDYVKQFLVSKWNISEDKIGMIYHGCKIENGAHPKGIRPLVLPKNIKSRGFLFTVGSICSYRGLEDIIEALGYLKHRSVDAPELLIAGKSIPLTSRYEHSIRKLIDKQGISDKIHWLGELDRDALGWCYANCALFLMTSRVEACPNIALEAMSYGCVCISTKNPPMPEFFKDYAVYYEAGDGMGLANTINSILKWEETKRVEMSRKARERAAEFPWEKTVKELIGELKSAV